MTLYDHNGNEIEVSDAEEEESFLERFCRYAWLSIPLVVEYGPDWIGLFISAF